MKIVEFYSCGDFLSGAVMARQDVVFACSGVQAKRRVIKANFPVEPAWILHGLAESIPRYDVACVGPMEDEPSLLRVMALTRPRVILMDGAHEGNCGFVAAMLGDSYRLHRDTYVGRQFGLPRLDSRELVLLTRGDVRPTERFHWPEAPAGTRLDAVLRDVMEGDGSPRLRQCHTASSPLASPDEPIGTLRSDYYRRHSIPSAGGPPRWMTLLEAKRMTGLPDGFELPMPDALAWDIVVGCSWPPVVAAILAELDEWLFS